MFSVGNHCCLLPQVVSKMFKELQWEKIVIVYGDDAYGVGGYQEVLRAAYEAEVCVSGAISVPHLGPDSEYEEKLRNIASYGATAAVFFGNPTDAVSTMKVSCWCDKVWSGVSHYKLAYHSQHPQVCMSTKYISCIQTLLPLSFPKLPKYMHCNSVYNTKSNALINGYKIII